MLVHLACYKGLHNRPTWGSMSATMTDLLALTDHICQHGRQTQPHTHSPAGPLGPDTLARVAMLAWCERRPWVLRQPGLGSQMRYRTMIRQEAGRLLGRAS